MLTNTLSQAHWATRTRRPLSTVLVALHFLLKGLIYMMPDDTMLRSTQVWIAQIVNYDKFWGVLCVVTATLLVLSIRCHHRWFIFCTLTWACAFQLFLTALQGFSVWPRLPVLMGSEIVVSLLCLILFASFYDRRRCLRGR